MTKETLKLLHKAYNEALRRSNNIMDILNNLYKIVDETDFPESDMNAIDSFLDGLRGCINTRKKTFEITNVCTYICIVLMYIILWWNATQGSNIDVSWHARRKGLESELTKLLKKSIEEEITSYVIRDRFGLRAIIWNDEGEEEATAKIYTIYENIVGILAGKSRKAKKEFQTWIEENPRIGILDKTIISYILNNIPFGMEAVKNYIESPKENGYRTLQGTLSIQMYSELLPGTQLELQLRTKKMHEDAEKGKASHELYKEEGVGELSEVFKVDDFSSLNIPGFTGYQKDQDVDGIHWAKEFFDRRLSCTLVPEN